MKSVKKNYIYNLSYQVMTLITPLLTTPYLARTLGADGIGKVSYAESIVSYYVLFATMGTFVYGQREVSYCQDDVYKRSLAFWNTKIFQAITSSIALVGYFFLIDYFHLGKVSYVLAFEILAVLFDVTWFFQGIEEFGKIVTRNFIIKLINIIYIFVFIKDKNDVLWYAFGVAFFTFLSNALLWPYMRKYVVLISLKRIHPFTNAREIISLFIPAIATQIYTVLDKTMIGLVSNSSFQNGYYEQAMKISKIVLTIVTALGTVILPRIGYYFNNKNETQVKELMYNSYRFVFFLGMPLSFGLYSTAAFFVPWFFGDGYKPVILLLEILAFIIVPIGISNLTGTQYLTGTKRQNVVTMSVFIGAIINLVFNIIFIPMFASIGAAIASVLAETIIAIVQLYFVRKELNVMQVVTSSLNYLIASVVMMVALKIYRCYFPSETVGNTIVVVVIGGCVYFAVLFVCKDTFIKAGCDKVKQIIKRR